MRKIVEKIVLLLIICFAVFKILTFVQEVYEEATTISKTYHDKLETILQEDVR